MFILRTTGTSCSEVMNTGASTTPPVQSSTGTSPNFQPFQEGPTAVGKPTSTPGSSQVCFETWFQTWMTPPFQSCWYRFTIRGQNGGMIPVAFELLWLLWCNYRARSWRVVTMQLVLDLPPLLLSALVFFAALDAIVEWMPAWVRPVRCFFSLFLVTTGFLSIAAYSSFIVLSWSVFFSSFRCLTCISCSFPSSFSFVLRMFFSHWGSFAITDFVHKIPERKQVLILYIQILSWSICKWHTHTYIYL